MIGPGPQIHGGSLRFCPSPDNQQQCPDLYSPEKLWPKLGSGSKELSSTG